MMDDNVITLLIRQRETLEQRLQKSSIARFAGPAPELEYLIHEFLPRKGTGLLSGATTIGKSMFTLELGACLATGIPLFQHRATTPCRVLILAAEDDDDELHRRIAEIRAWLRGFNRHRWDAVQCALDDNLHVISTIGIAAHLTMRAQGAWTFSKDVDVIAKHAADIGASLVVLDPLSRFRSGSMNDDEEGVVIVEALERIAQAINGFCLLTTHVTKATNAASGDGVYASAGSSVIANHVRWTTVLRAPADAEAKRNGWLDEAERNRYATLSQPKFSHGAKIPRVWFKRHGRLLLEHEIKSTRQQSRDAEYQRIAVLLVDLVKRARLNNEQPTRRELIRKYADPSGPLACSEHTLKWVIDDAIDDGKLIVVALDTPKRGGAKEYISAP